MPITLITGPANAGKARCVLDFVRRHVAHGERPLLVVPTGADADRYRQELAQDGPVLGVEVCLFSGLLERVARCAAGAEAQLGRAPLSAGAREQMLLTLLGGLDGAPHPSRSLARALGAAIADLQAAGVTPARLRVALGAEAAGGGELRVAILEALHGRYNQALSQASVLDAELRTHRALNALRRSPALWGAGRQLTPVLVYGFDDLTAIEMDAIETIGRHVDAPVTVALAYERGRVAFAGRAWAFEELAPLAAEHLELPADDAYYSPSSRPALHHMERRLFEVGDEDASSVSLAGVELHETPCERDELRLVAERVRTLLDEGLSPADIAIVHRVPARVADSLARELDALAVPHAIERRIRFGDTALGRALTGLLACGCVGLQGVARANVADLLAWLRAPGLLDVPELADLLEERVLRSGLRDAASAREMWEREHWPLDAIERVSRAAARGPVALLEHAQRELIALFQAPLAREAALIDPFEDEAASALRAGLQRISEMQELERVGSNLLGGVAGVLEALRECTLALGGGVRGEAVVLLDPLSLRARRVRALLLCGLQEGTFPCSEPPDPILSSQTRASIAAVCGSRLARRQDALAAERHLLYETVSRPQETLVVSWHACSDDGLPTPRSPFVDDLCDLFGSELTASTARPWQQGAAAGARGGIDGLLDERLLAELRERRLWSASSLERFAACPARWFIERMLGAEDLEPEPEPRARGTLAHAVLQEVMEQLRQQNGSARMSPSSLPLARELALAALRDQVGQTPLSVRPERQEIAQRRLQADLDRYLRFAAEQESPLEPAHIELSFGLGEQPDALPALRLGDEVLLCGRIDRVDVGGEGQAVVYDYKSGRTGPELSGARWAQAGRFQMALYMRAVEDLVGLQPVGGLYQPLAGADLRARGALCSDAGLEIACVRTDACDREQLTEMLHAASNAALEAASQAREGRVRPRPQSCAYGGGCMYPTICRCGS